MQLHLMAAHDNCIFLNTISYFRIAAQKFSRHLENAKNLGETNPELEIYLKFIRNSYAASHYDQFNNDQRSVIHSIMYASLKQ